MKSEARDSVGVKREIEKLEEGKHMSEWWLA